MIPMREQVENYNIVSFPLPDWMRPEADRYGDFISAYIFQKEVSGCRRQPETYIVSGTVLRSDSGYNEEECSKNKACKLFR